MTPIFYDFYTGRMFEALMWGLVFALLAIVVIWAAIELATRVFPSMKGGNGNHLGWNNLLRFFRDRHATT